MCAPAASCRIGTRLMSCASSAASSGSISGEGRPKTNRTPSLARQRASSAPPLTSAIGHLPGATGRLLAALARVGPGGRRRHRRRAATALGCRPMHIPHFMRRVNRMLTNPLMGTFAWLVPPLAVVHHVGRKSGRAYRTPVVAFRHNAGVVIPMTYGRDVDWAQNILRAKQCELDRLGRRLRLRTPRILGFDRAKSRLPAALHAFFRTASFPGYVLLDG